MNSQALTRSTLESVQWFIFLLAKCVALPIVIGTMFELDFIEICSLMQRTFFVVGLASLLQALIGHRLPIMEGPAGVWISIFAVGAITGVQNNTSLNETLQFLEMTMIFTGILLFLFGLLKISEKILPIFTPLVTGIFFMLLTVQLSGTFLKGMLGIGSHSTTIHIGEAILAFITFIIIIGLSIFGRGWISNYAIFIGIGIGWICYYFLSGKTNSLEFENVFSLPQIFAFGTPQFDLNVIPIAFITAIVLISNLVASIIATSQTLGIKTSDYRKQINHGTALSGINTSLSGIFSSIANVPVASSAGFIALTGQKDKKPFIYANLLLILIAFFPPIVSIISSIPAPIANATLMASFIHLVTLGFQNVSLQPLDFRKCTILGIAYLIGMGTMFLPTEIFFDLPSFAQNVLSNGLLVGTSVAIIIEQLWKEKTDSKVLHPKR